LERELNLKEPSRRTGQPRDNACVETKINLKRQENRGRTHKKQQKRKKQKKE